MRKLNDETRETLWELLSNTTQEGVLNHCDVIVNTAYNKI